MDNIPSAKDYLISTGAMYFTKEDLKAEALINFAKLHVEAAIKEAICEAPMHCTESIKECYPLTNIK